MNLDSKNNIVNVRKTNYYVTMPITFEQTTIRLSKKNGEMK